MKSTVMVSTRNQLIELIEQAHIPAERVNEALVATEILPDGKVWLRFINHLLLWLGALAIAFAAVFFIAYNWDDLDRFTKFGMVEALIALALLAHWKLYENNLVAKVTLLIASIFLGVLLALYGQTYQTGADPWQLFFNWALLMLPWAVIGCFPAIWILWITLINLSIVLYYTAFRGAIWIAIGSDFGMLWTIFAFNTFALILWELLSNKWQWLTERWAVRLLAIGSGIAVTWLAIYTIFDYRNLGDWSGLIWVIWLAGLYFVYRKIRHDLFMLAGLALSVIVVVTSFASKHLLKDFDAGALLAIALMIIGMGTGAAIWLRNIHQEFQS